MLAAALNMQRHAVEDLARRRRAGAGHARLAAPVDRVCPRIWFGIIFDTASTSSMHAIAAAREMADPESARRRRCRPDLIVYASEQAHSSIEKGAIAIGIGQENVRKVPVDAEFRMRPDALAAAIEQRPRGRAAPVLRGRATVGTTVHHQRRSGARHRRYLPSATDCGCTWTPPTPARPPSRRSSSAF